MAIETAIFIFILGVALLFFYGMLKLTWSISKGGIDIMEFFGNAGRPGTSREQTMNDYKKKRGDTKWNGDGHKI
jgi:hypothetical protein